MNEEYVLFLEDILHTGNHGPEGESKVGDKYDRRRNTYCHLIPEDPSPGESVQILHYYDPEDMERQLPVNCTFTTPFVSMTEDNDYVYLRTVNSIYKFKKWKEQ